MRANSRWRLILSILLWTSFCSLAVAVKPGEPAPILDLPLMGHDKHIVLSKLKGKIVYVDFWASWCGPCRQSLPLYEALYQRLSRQNFEILAVNLDEDFKDAEKFLQRHPVSYPVLLDPSGDSAKTWSVLAMPSSYLVDSDGNLANIYTGFKASHIGDIEDDIKALLHDISKH